MDKYNVTGMSCAACQVRVEKAVSEVQGVNSCSVSLLTNSMGVEGSASPDDIIKAVEAAGYGASLLSGDGNTGKSADSFNEKLLEDTETPKLLKRLIASVILVLVLMYFSMGHMMFSWPIPKWFMGNHVAMALVEMFITEAVCLINKKFFVSGFKGLVHKSPNMDTLVALGAGASFLYSVWMTFLMTDAQVRGGEAAAMMYMDELYYESAAMILTLITVGKTLEAYSKGKTTNALKSLMRLTPKTATLVIDGKETEVEISKVVVGDIFVVRPGESIPVDGTVLEGFCSVDESALTGESVPVDKEPGEKVSAATINKAGFIKCRAESVGNDTTISKIIQMVSDAAATKAPIAKIADKVSGIFVPVVMGIALITFAVWLLLGNPIGYALARGVSVLVISCPCALGLATPVAIMVGNGMGARNGILYKTAASLEAVGRLNIVVMDKTGTITTGTPSVTDMVTAKDVTEQALLETAFSLECKSEHPLAKAVVEYAVERNIKGFEITHFEALPGNGLKGALGDREYYGGSLKYAGSLTKLPEDIIAKAESFADEGKTPLFFMQREAGRLTLLGIIAVADTIKADAEVAVKELAGQGIEVVMLTGDNGRTAASIAAKAGITHVVSDVYPDAKEAVIRRLKEAGSVAMVGDGINDAPALTTADVGIAVGAGTDVAIDAADVVLVNNELLSVPRAIRLGRKTLRNIHENLFWAFFYNVIGIPLAAGVYVGLFGWSLNPMFGALAMSLSSFCVVTNALRLNLFNVKSGKSDRKKAAKEDKVTDIISRINEENRKEKAKMTKTMKIEGMMCGHCEARVKKTLEALEGVSAATVSHENGTAVVELSVNVDDAVLKSAVEAQDYKVVSIS